MQKLLLDIYPHKNQVVQDAYDILIANLHTENKQEMPKTICVAGACPKVGKTTVALNLAISMAMAGWKVVFVDADMRKSRTSKRIDEPTLLGLSDYLTTQMLLADAMCKTNVENLTIITSGDTQSVNPIGLLCSPRFADMTDKLSLAYDFIVFDTPCLNSVGDGSVVAAHTDCTLLVLEAGYSKQKDMRQSIERLQTAGAKVAGIVLNKAKKTEYKRYLSAYNYFSRKKQNEAASRTGSPVAR